MKAYAISPKSQVTIPVFIRKELNLKPGDKILYEITPRGVLLKPARRSLLDDYGFLKGRRSPGEDLESIREAVRVKMAEGRLQK